MQILHGIPTDAVMVETARVIAKTGLELRTARQLINDIKSEKRSEASQMAIVSKWQQSDSRSPPPIDEAPKAIKKSRVRFLVSLGIMEHTLKGIRTLKQLGIDNPNEQKELAGRLHAISAKLRKLGGI